MYDEKDLRWLKSAWQLEETFYWIEFGLEILSVCIAIFATLILRRIHPWHYNFTLLIYSLAALIFFSMLVGVYMFVYALRSEFHGYLDDEPWMYNCSAVRIVLMSAAALAIPGAVMERTAATYLAADYELKRRRCIPFSIITMEALFALTTTLIGGFELLPQFAVASIYVLINLVALLQFSVLQRWNKRLRSGQLSRCSYSLSERFQVAENVLSCRIIRLEITVAGSAAGILSMAYSAFTLVVGYSDWPALAMLYALNWSVPIISIVLISIPFFVDERWRKDLRSAFISPMRVNRVYREKVEYKCDVGKVRLLWNTDGKQMSFRMERERQLHFEMLNKDWK